jgi:hypothetical protein
MFIQENQKILKQSLFGEIFPENAAHNQRPEVEKHQSHEKEAPQAVSAV